MGFIFGSDQPIDGLTEIGSSGRDDMSFFRRFGPGTEKHPVPANSGRRAREQSDFRPDF